MSSLIQQSPVKNNYKSSNESDSIYHKVQNSVDSVLLLSTYIKLIKSAYGACLTGLSKILTQLKKKIKNHSLVKINENKI